MDDPALVMFGWLIFAIGAGVILIGLRTKSRSRSWTRRIADVLSGFVFFFMAGTVIVPDLTSSSRLAFVGAAVLCGLTSWFLGRHVKRMDRALHSS